MKKVVKNVRIVEHQNVNNMIVKFKKLREDAVTPKYAKVGDAGMDMVCASREYNAEHKYWEYNTGIAVEIPEGYVGLLFPRSSVSKRDMRLCNSVGVVDSGYRGEIKFRFKSTSHISAKDYWTGDKIGQLIIMPIPTIELVEVTELSSTDRGEGGFGSTGK
jgi:dUTP pyrophosphatase